ncbi:MAG: RNA polymerase sigma factor [Spirochaetaceae bacterium]
MDQRAEFKAVYDAVYPLIVRIVYGITRELHVAEELCQDAFIRYYQRMDTIPTREQAKYWLIRVSKNLALNHEKQRGREQTAYQRAYRQPARRPESGESTVLREETYHAVQNALTELPENLRAVLVMREYGNLSYREIAESLQISESNVKVRMHRARERLAKVLKEADIYVP